MTRALATQLPLWDAIPGHETRSHDPAKHDPEPLTDRAGNVVQYRCKVCHKLWAACGNCARICSSRRAKFCSTECRKGEPKRT